MRRTIPVLATLALLAAPPVAAQVSGPGTVAIETATPYPQLVQRLEQAVADNGMAVVARASATIGAAQRGLTIPGNAVVMVFRNDFATRMLGASVAAGFEAPIRYYVTERPDGGANLSYRTPSAVFAPYRVPAIDALAQELDPIFAKIAADATTPR